MNVVRSPLFLIAGGIRAREGRDPLIAEILAQMGKRRPSIAYVGVASDEDPDFMDYLTGRFKRSGAGEIRLAPLVSANGKLREAKAIMADSDLVFLSGGDVDVGMRRLRRSGVIPFLKRLRDRGKPFFGMSAGSIMMARNWVRWHDPEDDATAEVFPCMGFARLFCDTHAEADDWVELKRLLKLKGHGLGYGIPSGGALRVDPTGEVAALGKPAQRFALRDGRVRPLAPLTPL